MSAEAERLAAFHGPRLQARLERAITEQLARRRLARLRELRARQAAAANPPESRVYAGPGTRWA